MRIGIIGLCATTLDLPLLVRSGVFFFSVYLRRADFWCVFGPVSGRKFLPSSPFGVFSTVTKALRSMQDCSSISCNLRVASGSSRLRRWCKVLKKLPWAVDAVGGGWEWE